MVERVDKAGDEIRTEGNIVSISPRILVGTFESGQERVEGKVKKDGGERTALFESVWHVDRDLMWARKNRNASNIGEKDAHDRHDPFRDPDSIQDCEQVSAGYRVVSLVVVMKHHVVVLAFRKVVVESRVHFDNILFQATPFTEGPLRSIQKVGDCGGNELSNNICDDPVIGVADRDWSELRRVI